ncbi:replication factor C large subunit [Candidatus Woesearchaeota archaeon]|nr:replication factor C large subunit [Candidatus Woesearchaeota archaeon]
MDFVEKYRPKNSKDVVGQEKAIYELNKVITNFKKGKPIILYGPYGSGKTCAVQAIASELDKEVYEINASDYRSKNSVEETLGNAVKQQSLIGFGKGKIILVDDVDGMSGTKDRGGLTVLGKFATSSPFPIIMTLNNPYDQKFSSIRKKSVLIEFKELEYKDVFERLKVICDNENIEYEDSILEDLAMRSGGDLRGAITDLQMLTGNGKLDNLDVVSERNRTENMINALLKIFKTKDGEIASSAFDDVDEDFDKRMLWLEENLPKEYEGQDLANAFDCLSKADVFLGRIRRWQYWRFLVYASNQMSSGVALAKKERYKKFVQYKPTTKILKLWIYKNKYLKRKVICEKIAHKCHTSEKRVLKDIYPYVEHMIKLGNFDLVKEFDLNSEEVMWIKKQ